MSKIRRTSLSLSPSPEGKGKASSRSVVTVKVVNSSGKSGDLSEDKLLPGDIVEQVLVASDDLHLSAPFAGGKAGLQRELRRLHSAGQTLLGIKVRRGPQRMVTMRALIVLEDSTMLKKKQYALRSLTDPSHVVIFVDSSEEECLALEELWCARLASHLAVTQLSEISVSYQWEEKMKQVHPGGVGMIYSMLVVPYAPETSGLPQYNNLEDTVARAMAWLWASQISGVPINFLNIQTEPLLTKVSGQEASSRSVSASSSGNLASIVNAGIYGFEDYHGIDIGVVRAVRVWYVPNFAEVSITLMPEKDETRLGVGISRTEEGFCHVSMVEEGTCADRAGLRDLLMAAQASQKLLVVARLAGEKVTPWLISSAGQIHCFDTSSISHKLLAYRVARHPVHLHLMALESAIASALESSQEFEGMTALSSEESDHGSGLLSEWSGSTKVL